MPYVPCTVAPQVLNNHFDTDGVLAVWACLEPTEALRHAALLCEGAEAGDFGEWSSDRGVQLDAAIEAVGGGGRISTTNLTLT